MFRQQQQQQHYCGASNAAHYRRLTILLLLSGVTTLWLAACAQAVEFYMPDGQGDDGEALSRAIVTRKQWDMSKSRNIPDWLLLLSVSPRQKREQPAHYYKYDGDFTGFAILYHRKEKQALMLADVFSVLRASIFEDRPWDPKNDDIWSKGIGWLRGWDLVRERPRLRPTDTTWHQLNETYLWRHLFTFGQTNIGIFRVQYGDAHHDVSQFTNSTSDKNKWEDDLIIDDGDKNIIDDHYDDSKPTTTKRPISWWKIPVWKWTNPNYEFLGGEWVLPERGLLDINCWAFSYAYSHDGKEPYEGKRLKQRFWARWPVTPVEPCWDSRPLCKFKFDTERAVLDVKDKDTLRPQGYPCLRYQDTSAPIFCSEEKDWADAADPRIELSYIIQSWAPEVQPNANMSAETDYAYECFKDQRNEFYALNLQNMTFLLQNPTWYDPNWTNF